MINFMNASKRSSEAKKNVPKKTNTVKQTEKYLETILPIVILCR